MELTRIEDILARINRLVDGWKSMNAVPAVERDVALAALRTLYEQLLDMHGDESLAASVGAVVATAESVESVEVKADEVAAPAPAAAPMPAAESKEVVEVDDTFADILDIEALLGLSPEERNVVEEPQVAEPIVPAEVVPAPTPEPIPAPAEVVPAPTPTPAPINVGGGLFDIEDIPVRKKTNRKMISLYNVAPVPAAEPVKPTKPAEQLPPEPVKPTKPAKQLPPEPVKPTKPAEQLSPEPHPAAAPRPVSQTREEEAPKRLGDVLGSGVTTLADRLVNDTQPTLAMSRITDLRKAIGLNDKFLMVRDLFDGDVARYEDTIDTLNDFDDLDDCMIYIIENFAWNPDLEGAKLLVSLIERKLA